MRKVISSCFSDSNYEPVWRESVSQAVDMGRYWSSHASVETTADDTRTLSLNVMSKAGFGKVYPFKGHHEGQTKLHGSDLSYKDALQTILENSMVIMVLGTKFLAKPWLPLSLKKLHYACSSFQAYMTELYEVEKEASTEKDASERNLMTSLLRSSQQETEGSLTESEIYGNSEFPPRTAQVVLCPEYVDLTSRLLVFVFNFAGHDTTAHTFVFIMYYLAGNPQVQDWLYEEIQHVFGDRPQEEWNYRTDFPRLKRCLSVVFESLRLYSPVGLAKWTDNHSTTLQVGEKTLVIPPKTMVIPSNMCTQTHPKYWGADSLTWRPSRWIKSGASSAAAAADVAGEEFITPVRGTFVAWADGARDCPGKKFAQVEAVATIAALFKDWRVDPVLKPGESIEAARKRVLDFIVEDTGMVLLVQLVHPERCPLVWRKR